jgi:hypothetical protein
MDWALVLYKKGLRQFHYILGLWSEWLCGMGGCTSAESPARETRSFQFSPGRAPILTSDPCHPLLVARLSTASGEATLSRPRGPIPLFLLSGLLGHYCRWPVESRPPLMDAWLPSRLWRALYFSFLIKPRWGLYRNGRLPISHSLLQRFTMYYESSCWNTLPLEGGDA